MSRPYFGYLLYLWEEKNRRLLERRAIRDVSNPFSLPQNEFLHTYRISKEMAHYLCAQMQVDLEPLSSDGLPVHIKVLTAVKYLADGGYQRPTGQDHNLCIAQTTVSKYLAQFVSSINQRLMPQWIKFPGTEEGRTRISQGYREKFGIPNIIGTIDCTHVSIFPPPRPQGVQYMNRKGVHTLNVQLIADVDCKILNVNARYPGRVHDQFIYNNSVIKQELKRLYEARIGQYFLLGDSGYGLEPWLMTPILNAEINTPEDRYTKWHCRARNTIERTNGYLKGTFRSLGIDRTLHYTPKKASELVTACCTLYNMMKHYRVPMDHIDITEDENHGIIGENVQPAQILRAAQEKRNVLVQTYFN